jgi:predicted nucleic acid-binding protein
VHGAAIDGMLDEDFRGRSLPFCCSAASACALIPITRRAAGRPISQFDCRISAIASARSANVPTRYTGDYDGCGLEMIDPWHSKGNR